MELLCIRCQEKTCPYGKKNNQRCIFGELYLFESLKKLSIRERHKCPKANRGDLQYVDVDILIEKK